MSPPTPTRMTMKASIKTVQRRNGTVASPEHLTFTFETDSNILLTLHLDPDEYYEATDHLHAARVEELLTVDENEVNEALASSHDALREVGASMVAIRAGIRKRFRTSTGTPAIEDFNTSDAGGLDGEDVPITGRDDMWSGSAFGHDATSTPGDMEPSDEAIDDGNEVVE